MKRLLILATTVPTSPADGTPSFITDLAASLGTDISVTILAPRVAGSAHISEVGDVTVVRFPYFFRRLERLAGDAIMPRLRAEPWRLVEAAALVLSMIWHSWRITSRRAFDAVNAHWLVPAGVAAWIVNKTRRIPYVVTVHGADAYTLNGRLSRWVKRRVLRSSAAVLPVSADIGKVVRDVGGRQVHIDHVVPMGVGPRSVVVTERTAGAFLFVGRLADKKGVEVAIRALPAVPQACLRIVGEGPERSRLVDLVDQLGLTDQVEFLGRLGREEVFAQMERCFGLLIPSVTAPDGDRDGTPVVLAEAMSCGTTVIASDIAGLGDQIEDGDTGWLVPPGDVGALSRMLTRALADADGFIELGREARERFSGGPLDIRSTAAVYRKVLAEVTP